MSGHTARAPGDGYQASGVAQPRGPLRVAYLTGRYPEISHAFIIGEVRAMRRRGAVVETFSVWRTAGTQLLSHADQEEYERTYAMLPPRLGHFARAQLAAVLCAPRAWMAVFAWGVRFGAP